jgi:hypothetical protein
MFLTLALIRAASKSEESNETILKVPYKERLEITPSYG